MISSGLTYLSIMHRSGNDVFNPINSIFLWLHSEISTDVNSFYSLICFSYHTYQSEDNIISAYLYLFSIFFIFLFLFSRLVMVHTIAMLWFANSANRIMAWHYEKNLNLLPTDVVTAIIGIQPENKNQQRRD